MPWRLRELVLECFPYTEIRDVEVYKNGEWTLSSEFVIPSQKQFQAYLAGRFLDFYGPRKLASFIQRCQATGPWAEKIEVWKKDKRGESHKFIYSKLEYELVKLQKIFRSHLSLSDRNQARYEELQVTMSPELMVKSDDQLMAICNDWIKKLTDSEK